ncbi:MAG: hypothetical protein RIC56_01945 [Pseudomonadales bacterium]
MLWALAVEERQLNGFELDDALVPARQIQPGGPPRDGIPSIDLPRFVSAAVAEFLGDNDRVLAIEVERVASTTTGCWFAWYAFIPDTEVFRCSAAPRPA